jgi:TP901 family phage tail tape measure protein
MASNRIKGITIEIDGDTTKFTKSLDSAEKSSRSLQSELKGVNSLLKLDPSNVELLKQKQDILTESIKATKDKLDTLKNAQAQVQAQFEHGDITVEQYRDFQREIIATEQKLKRLKDEQKDFGSVVEQQMKVAGKKVEEFGGKVEEAGKKFSILSAGATAGLGYAVTTAGSLEGAVNKVSVATGASKEKTEELKEVLKSIHDNNYGEDYNDIAEKMALVKQNLGDISNTDLQNITERAYMLEDAFGMDFNETLRGVNGLMTNMGLTAEQAFDYLVVGAQNGLDKSGELADNIAEYSQLWGQAGFSAEEMFVILQNGLDSGAYNLDKVNDLVKEMGISLTDGRIEENLSSFSKETQNLFKEWQNGGASQSDVIKSIINDFSNMENEQEALTLAGTVWSALGEDNAMKIITSLGDVNNTYKDVTGSVQEASDQMYSGTGVKAEQAMKKIQTAFQTMGDAILPILTPIIEKIAALATKFSNLNPTIQKIVLVVMGLVAAAGPVLIFVGKIISSVGTIIGVLGKLAPLFKIIKTAITGITTVVKLLGSVIMANPVVAIIAGIIAVLVLLYTKCEWFRDLVNNIFKGIVNALKSVGSFLAKAATWVYENVIKPIVDFYIAFYTTVFKGIINAIKWVGSILVKAATWVYENVIKPIIAFYIAFYTTIFEGIVNAIKWIGSILSKVATWIYENVIKPVVDFFVKCYETIKNALVTAWNFYISILKTVATWVYENVIKPVVDFFVKCYETIKTAFVNAWNFIKNIFSTVATWINTNVVQPIVNFFTSLWNSIKNIFSNVKTFFTDKFKQAYNGIKEAFGGVKDWFDKNVWGKIKSVFSGAKKKMAEIGGKIWSGLKSAFKNPLGLKVTYDTNVGKVKKAIYSALGLDGWPKLSFAAKGAVSRKPTPLLTGEYPGAVNNPEITTPQSIMRDTMMDALTSFNNQRYQNGSNGDIGELTRLLKQYMPQIVENMDKDMVLDGRKVGKLIAPTINKELGVISEKEQRGY